MNPSAQTKVTMYSQVTFASTVFQNQCISKHNLKLVSQTYLAFFAADWRVFPNALMQLQLALKSEGEKPIKRTQVQSHVLYSKSQTSSRDLTIKLCDKNTAAPGKKTIYGPGGRLRAIAMLKESHRISRGKHRLRARQI